MNDYKKLFDHDIKATWLYIKVGVKWLVMALLVAAVCGPIGALFSESIVYVTKLRHIHPWLLYFLPLAGLVIVFMYERFHVAGMGTNNIIKAARHGTVLNALLIPAIFVSTVITHLFGGSAGREGAALQIGGGIANYIGRILHMKKEDFKIMTRVGMASSFSALFGTPLAAAAFGTMVVNVGDVPYSAILPGLISSITSAYIARILGGEVVQFKVMAPAYHPFMYIKIIILAILCAIVSIIFVKTLIYAHKFMTTYIKNSYIRILVGGCLVVVLTLLIGNTDYNGAGMDIIEKAIVHGEVKPTAFLMKIIFTAITLESGYKGGEVVPSFFIGATFGCFAAKLLGIPAGFGAAIGMIGVFGAATNSFLSPLFLAMEVFQGVGLLYFALAAIICFIFSGYSGLYTSQRIIFSKVGTMRVDANPNLYHTGDKK